MNSAPDWVRGRAPRRYHPGGREISASYWFGTVVAAAGPVLMVVLVLIDRAGGEAGLEQSQLEAEVPDGRR